MRMIPDINLASRVIVSPFAWRLDRIFNRWRDADTPSAPPAPTWKHAETNARENGSSQSLAVGNRNETGLLITYFDDSHGNSPYSSTAAAALAPSTGIAHTSGTRPRSVAI